MPSPLLALNARVRRGRDNPVYVWFIENIAGRSLWLPHHSNHGGAQMTGYRFWGTSDLPLCDPALFEVKWVEFLPWETMPLWQNAYIAGAEPDEMIVEVRLRDGNQEETVSLLWKSGHK